MKVALREADKAARKGEVPIGAVAVYQGKVLACAHNIREKTLDPVGHAEILLLRKAARKLKSWRMPGLEIYVTLEPCLMCLSAMHQARVSRVFFAAPDPKAGACGSVWPMHRDPYFQKMPVIGGVLAPEALRRLQIFFKKLRTRPVPGTKRMAGARHA